MLGMAAVVFLLFSKFPANPRLKETAKKETPTVAGPTIQTGQKKMSGKVLPLPEPTAEGATHQLINDQGKIILLLKTNDDKLKFSEGFDVTVIGEVKSTPQGELMTVEEVGYGVE